MNLRNYRLYNSPLKWVGSKQKILSNILPYIGEPKTFVEPFLGSATVALNVHAKKYVLNDMNYDLINLYLHLINDSALLIEQCHLYFDSMDKDKYYDVREQFNACRADSVERAALFLVLNKFAFNGVCRYNKSGLFNVPYGKLTRQSFPQKDINNLIKHFDSKEIVWSHGDFANGKLYENLGEGDVVYFDPPYLPAEEFDSNFTSYTKEDFSYPQHQHIVEICKKLSSNGVVCLVSNHLTPATQELYKDAQQQITIPKQRLISSNKETRMVINEVLAVYGNVVTGGKLFDE